VQGNASEVATSLDELAREGARRMILAALELEVEEYGSSTVTPVIAAAHWKHIRTTNPIESTFATVKLRTRVTKGADLMRTTCRHSSAQVCSLRMGRPWNEREHDQRRTRKRSPLDHFNPQLLTISPMASRIPSVSNACRSKS